MTAENPYAPPAADVELIPDNPTDVWREGKLLVMHPDAVLPDRCVKCNQPAERRRLTTHVYSYHWAALLAVVTLVFVFWPVALLLAILVRKHAKVELALCARHRRIRLWLGVASLIAMGVGTVALSQAAFNPLQAYVSLAATLAATGIGAGLVLALIRGQPLRGKRITKQRWWLRGAKPPFLDSLPDLPAEPTV